MQGDELVPGGKNILARRAGLRAPHRVRRDRPVNPLKNLRKSARFEIGAHPGALFSWLLDMVVIMTEDGDDSGAQFVRLGVSQFQRRDLLEMVMQQPGVIDQGLQDQRLAPGDRAALAAHDRAQGELGAGGLIWPAVDGLAGEGVGRTAIGTRESTGARGERPARGKPTTGLAGKMTAAKIAPAVAATAALRREGLLQPLGEILAIIAPHHLVADAVAEFAN